jgi:2-oxoglutarate ferredoxin oxidoreductase subunit gamma
VQSTCDSQVPCEQSLEARHGRLEVRLSGSGGQGILLAATLLADLCLQSGEAVVQTQSYGPEARGGASKAEVVISDISIDYPEVVRPDVTLCLSQPAFDKYGPDAPTASFVCYDSGLVKPAAIPGVELRGAPFTQLAGDELGKTVVANIVALSSLAATSIFGDPGALRDVIRRRVPARFLELNLKALELGLRTELRPPDWTEPPEKL